MPALLDGLVSILMCDDVPTSIAFYTDVLGFDVKNRMEDVGASGWAWLSHGSIDLMLASPSYVPKPVKVEGRYPQHNLYFYTSDVAALRSRVVESGCEATELEQRFYDMLEFEMVDPSGHVLVFGQDTREGSGDDD